MWENSREFTTIGTALARNRKTLKEKVDSIPQSGKGITFE